jgi:hypothetical protein
MAYSTLERRLQSLIDLFKGQSNSGYEASTWEGLVDVLLTELETNWIDANGELKFAKVAAGSAQPTAEATVAVTGDDQAVATAGLSLIRFTSDDTTAADRTIVLGAGTAGQILTLVLDDDTNAIQLADSGTASLSAAWEPGDQDTLTLVYDDTDDVWREIARSAN